MRENLIENTGGMRLANTRTNCTCAYSGETIPKSEIGIIFRMEDSREHKNRTYSAWVSPKYRTELGISLTEFEFEEAVPREEISPSGAIAYNKVKGKTISCFACGKSMDKGDTGISFANYTSDHRSRTAWCHVDCVPLVHNALNQISDIIFSDS